MTANPNIKGLLSGLAQTVSEILGGKLSTVGKYPSKLPSVFISNSKPPKPEHPYATVSFLDPGRPSRDAKHVRVTENGTVYEYEQEVVLRVNIYSNVDGDSVGLMMELQNLLITPFGLNSFQEKTGQEIFGVTNPGYFDSILNTDYEEVSSIDVRVALAVAYEDTSTGFITRTDIEGCLKDEFDGGDTLNADVSAPDQEI